MCCVSLEALIGYTCFYLGEVYFEECEDYLKAINKFHKNYEDFFLKLDENARFIIQNISTNVNQPLTAKQSVWEDGRHIWIKIWFVTQAEELSNVISIECFVAHTKDWDLKNTQSTLKGFNVEIFTLRKV